MAIIVTKLIPTSQDGSTYDADSMWADFVIVKEQFCPDPDDETFVTIGLGGGTEITKAQLKTRALDIHTRYPFNNVDMSEGNPPTLTEKTNAEVETMVDDWCAEKNVS